MSLPLELRVGTRVLVGVLLLAAALVLPAKPAAAVPDPCDVPLAGLACDAVGAVLGVGGDLAAGAANTAIGSFANWMAGGITDLLRTVTSAMFSGTEVDLFAVGQGGQQWFEHNYATMATIGLAVFAPMLLLAVLHALLTGARPGTRVAAGAPGTTDLAAALRHLVVPPRRRGLVVVVSDFLATDGWGRVLRGLAGRHEVVAVEVVDPRELELPPVGVLTLIDPETGRTREVPTDRRTRARYADAAAAQRRAIADEIRRAGASHLQLRTDRDWVLDVARFVQARRATAAAR